MLSAFMSCLAMRACYAGLVFAFIMFKDMNTMSTITHPQKIKVWGVFQPKIMGQYCGLEQNEIFNLQKYVKILNVRLLQ